MKIRLLILALAALFGSANLAWACVCGGYPTVCEAYRQADAVFMGSVQRIEKRRQKNENGEEYVGGQIVHVQVDKAFKGLRDVEAIFLTESSDCDAVFKESERWLFYAYYDKKSKTWGVHPCDRSTTIENAPDDLLYLQGLPASAQKTRLSGTLEHYEADSVKGFTRIDNIIGAKVKIIGKRKTYAVYTDKNGVYEIYGLPPGQYAVEPEVPSGLKIRFPMFYGETVSYKKTERVVLKEKSCASVSFVFSSDTGFTPKRKESDE